MRSFTAISVLSAALLVGCTPHMAMSDGSTKSNLKACKSKDSDADCYILVDVSPKDGGGCEVTVIRSQDTVGFKNDAKDKWIEWELTETAADSGFRFSSNGIEPKAKPDGNVAKWNKNFKNGGADHGGKQFKWKNLNDPQESNPVDYLYMVNVELRRPPAPPLTCTQDPVIRNQR